MWGIRTRILKVSLRYLYYSNVFGRLKAWEFQAFRDPSLVLQSQVQWSRTQSTD